MRVVAILAAYNEERFIDSCLEHLFEQGVDVYLIDNESTDRTVGIAERYLGRGLIGIETLPRARDAYRWQPILRRKEELAATLEADWFMHADPDEVRLPPRSGLTLAEAFAEVDGKGYNAVNFVEFTFVPTREAPDHDHPEFSRTVRHYYPFVRNFPSQIKAWKRQPDRV
ncbi:MAG: glycosyltransferase family 2 protein, partial [Rubrobacter sp.]